MFMLAQSLSAFPSAFGLYGVILLVTVGAALAYRFRCKEATS